MDSLTKFVVLLSYVIFILRISMARDTITANQHMKDDGETLISAGGSFELGFFQSGVSKSRYVGIWYKNVSVPTVVWVANRDIPLTDSFGVLKVTDQGTLVIHNSTNSSIWFSHPSDSAQNPYAQLLDSGNLVIKNENGNFLWQSFDHPSDTLIAGMKHGRNLVTGLDRYLSSWKSTDDPSKGSFTYGLDPTGYPQLFLKNDSAVIFRSGPWNGLRFSGFPELRPNPFFNYSFVLNETEMYFTFLNSAVLSRLVLGPDGKVQRWIWVEENSSWRVYTTGNKDECDSFAVCGAYSTCNIQQSPRCGCLKGFVPKFPHQWDGGHWSNGCVRNTSLDCEKGTDGFAKVSGVKLPDTRNTIFNVSVNLKECKSLCLRNCSCTAYSNSNISGRGSGCLLWIGALSDIEELNENGQDFFLRLAASELGASSKVKKRWIIVGTVSIVGMFLLSLVLTLYVLKKKKKKKLKRKGEIENYETNEREENLELPLFDLHTIFNATNIFSIENKLGEGGFGPVYKGTLQDGKEIAVKRLSKDSMQGISEFKNEVIYISKLQHRNLVKLLGCCIHGEEKMLIYEYMPNKSLDFFIFDQKKSMALDWPKRLAIINGIARGLLYLHQDSRLRIIHRDLKAENILLDEEMNPKISDFGMARSFGGNDTEANTRRVVGTFGYMSPEYASHGVYSVKSDVFSFGVLMLEIVSGKRNRGFNHPDNHFNLLGHAWTLHMNGRPSALIDAPLEKTCHKSEVLRALNVGLLCVQCDPGDRPNMSSVVLMLGGEGELPQPKEPGFFSHGIMLQEAHSSLYSNEPFSGDAYITMLLDGR